MHQEDFARAVLVKYCAEDRKPVDFPMKVGAPPLKPVDGTASGRGTLEFAMYSMGDPTWPTRCNPRLAYAAQHLAQFSHNPGPLHVETARRVLAYVRLNPGRGLVFHGSDAVLNVVYPHRHAMTTTCYSEFSHKGYKAVSCVSVLMNGAVIYDISRRQSTVGMTSTEAEVKAAAMASEVIAPVVPL